MAILAGQLLTASALNSLTGQVVILDADFPVANNTTFQNTALFLELESTSKYEFELLLNLDATTAADGKVNLAGPAGMTYTQSQWGSGTAVGAGVLDGTVFHDRFVGGPMVLGGVNAGTVITNRPIGVIRTAATAGFVTVQFAQVTANATPSILKADSMFWVLKG